MVAANKASVSAYSAPMGEAVKVRMPDDTAMLRLVTDVTRDLNSASPYIFWTDFLLSAGIGYVGLLGAMFWAHGAIAVGLCAVIAVIALYRAGSFIHELTHVRHRELPWFRFGFNVVIGLPMLVPSFMYEGVHQLHHARTRYGTAEDPEYLPLARMKPWTVPAFVLVAALAPIGLLLRYAVLSPLSVLFPPLRNIVVERYSGLVINPDFRRRPPEGELKRQWYWQEAMASVWAISLLALVAAGILSVSAFVTLLAIFAATVVLNQIRTLVAHLWENDGEPLTVTAQFLDSVNVPPPNILSALWAPVGLRYHALHHLVPGVPYHNLAEAHRRISAALNAGSTYAKANYKGLPGLVHRLVTSTF